VYVNDYPSEITLVSNELHVFFPSYKAVTVEFRVEDHSIGALLRSLSFGPKQLISK